jgi:hypothetical protein
MTWKTVAAEFAAQRSVLYIVEKRLGVRDLNALMLDSRICATACMARCGVASCLGGSSG